jgi:5-methyltetrahydropteroyltriglutamate--homocysteine methyltransferase
MKRSTNRILTTHVGSLIRPPQLLEFARARQAGDAVDDKAFEKCLTQSVADVVQRQVKAGIDIPDDGEFGKSTSWSLYALKRLGGFDLRKVTGPNPFARGLDRETFKEFYSELDGRADGKDWSNVTRTDAVCVGPIKYIGIDEVNRDISNLKNSLAGTGVDEAFLAVAAPSSAIPDRRNEYYKNDEECVVAVAEALRTEYRAIVDAGFLLQVDDARAAVTYDRMVPPGSFEDYYKWVARHVEVLNHALEGIPEDRIRYHVCWGSWPGPHTTDVPLGKIVDLVLKVKAGAYLIEAANPRHEHEWKVWQDVKLPEGKILVPGVISHGTNVVEHPELVADRLVRFAGCVGRENVIAGTDCGFAQEELNRRVHPSVMWAKLEAMVEGARLASKNLWGVSAA